MGARSRQVDMVDGNGTVAGDRTTVPARAGCRPQYVWHCTGQRLLEAKLGGIAQAKVSVSMETFLFRDPDHERFAAARPLIVATAEATVRL